MRGLGGRVALLAASLVLAGCEMAAIGGVVGAVTAASRPSPIPLPPPEPREATAAAEAAAAEAPPDAPAEAPQAETLPAESVDTLAEGPVAATLAGLRVLDTAGRTALEDAARRREADPGIVDRCALEVLEAVAAEGGAADAARWSTWLAAHAREQGAEMAIPGMVEIGDRARRDIRDAAGVAGLDPGPLTGFAEAGRLVALLAPAREAAGRCPPEAARPIADLLEAATTPED